MYDLKFCQLGLAGVRSDSRGFAADLPVVPLFAVGEIFLVRAFNLLHGTNIRSETEQTSESESSAHVHTCTRTHSPRLDQGAGTRDWTVPHCIMNTDLTTGLETGRNHPALA